MSFEAKYPGVCALCGGGIRPLQTVFHSSEGLAHVKCPTAGPQCPNCFTEKSASGECLCG